MGVPVVTMPDETDVPWTTAPEHVRRLVPRLDLDHDTVMAAYRLAREYDGEFGIQPLSVAVGAVYWAGLVENDKVTQERLEAASGVSNPTIRRAYRHIATAEGYDVAPRSRAAGPEDGDPSWSVTMPWPRWTPSLHTAIMAAVVLIVGYITARTGIAISHAQAAAMTEEVEHLCGAAGGGCGFVFGPGMVVGLVAVVLLGTALHLWMHRARNVEGTGAGTARQ